MSRVDEPQSCHYVLTVHTSRTCQHPLLRPPSSTKPQGIVCQPALSAQQYMDYVKAQVCECTPPVSLSLSHSLFVHACVLCPPTFSLCLQVHASSFSYSLFMHAYMHAVSPPHTHFLTLSVSALLLSYSHSDSSSVCECMPPVSCSLSHSVFVCECTSVSLGLSYSQSHCAVSLSCVTLSLCGNAWLLSHFHSLFCLACSVSLSLWENLSMSARFLSHFHPASLSLYLTLLSH